MAPLISIPCMPALSAIYYALLQRGYEPEYYAVGKPPELAAEVAAFRRAAPQVSARADELSDLRVRLLRDQALLRRLLENCTRLEGGRVMEAARSAALHVSIRKGISLYGFTGLIRSFTGFPICFGITGNWPAMRRCHGN